MEFGSCKKRYVYSGVNFGVNCCNGSGFRGGVCGGGLGGYGCGGYICFASALVTNNLVLYAVTNII
jgi:hypothetical protein